MDWLIPSNPNVYDSISAFNSLEFVDWKQNVNYQIGDVIFIYLTKPIQRIMIKAQVIEVDIPFSKTIDDKVFWTDENQFGFSKEKLFSRLKLLDFNENSTLTLEDLLKNGLLTAPQGPMRLKDNLLEYVLNNFTSQLKIVYPDEIANETENELIEGTLKRVSVNQYERNPIARQKCIEHYGTQCQICGMDFEKKYGVLGKGFIHVHHIIPISEVNKEYVIDYKNDLIPVCPNCHAMLHRKNAKGDFYLPNELKKLINN
ncbi:MAG: HNH endonuclease [Candidatus Izemoplasmatales bacterium]